MSINRETQQKISEFAKEQAQFYLDEAHMTYLEKIRAKGRSAKDKIGTELSRFRVISDQGKEAQDDMILYMNDYINDLILQGLSETEAFEKASTELSFASKSSQATSLQERFKQYYATQDLALLEAVGLYYGAGTIIGAVVGSIAGLLLGATLFKEVVFWVPLVVGVVVGGALGVGFGMLMNASLVRKNHSS